MQTSWWVRWVRRSVGGSMSQFAVVGPAMLLCGACSLVDPNPDYLRARDAIKAGTGHEAVWTPQDPALTEEQLQEFFAEGLTEKEAVQIALLNNRELQAAFYDIGVARADWVQSGLLANPVINTAIRFPPVGDTLNLLGDFSQNIADIWQIPARKKEAEGAVDQAVMRVAGVGNAVAGNVRGSYQRSVAAEELTFIAEQNAAQARATTELVRMARTGGPSPLDADIFQGDAMQADWDAQEARMEVANTRHELAKLLSLNELPDDVKLTDRLSPPPGDVPVDAAKAVAVARLKRVDLQAAGQAVATAESRIKGEYTKMFPAFNIGVSAERVQEVEEGDINFKKVIRDRIRSNSQALRDRVVSQVTGGAVSLSRAVSTTQVEDKMVIGPAIALTLPIFDQNIAQIAKAKYLHQQAIKQHEMLDTNAGHDVAMQYDRTVLATRNLAFVRDKLLPQAEKNLTTASSDYKDGRTGGMALLDVQRTLFDVRRRHLTARLNATAASGDLERAIGVPLATAAAITPEELAPPAAPEGAPVLSLPVPNIVPKTGGAPLFNVPVSPSLQTLQGALPTPTIQEPVKSLLEIVPKEEGKK